MYDLKPVVLSTLYVHKYNDPWPRGNEGEVVLVVVLKCRWPVAKSLMGGIYECAEAHTDCIFEKRTFSCHHHEE